MHRGLELFRRGKWAAAAEDFRAVLAEDPKDPSRGPARSRLSWSYHELGRDADAADEIVRLLEISPSSWRAEDRAGLLLLRAEFYKLAGKPDLARADRDLAAEVVPKLAEAANERAWHWLMPSPDRTPAENWRFVPAALILARKAVELAPDEPMYWNTLGVALRRNGNYDEARAVLLTNLAAAKAARMPGICSLWPCATSTSAIGKPLERATTGRSHGSRATRIPRWVILASWPNSRPRPGASSACGIDLAEMGARALRPLIGLIATRGPHHRRGGPAARGATAAMRAPGDGSSAWSARVLMSARCATSDRAGVLVLDAIEEPLDLLRQPFQLGAGQGVSRVGVRAESGSNLVICFEPSRGQNLSRVGVKP